MTFSLDNYVSLLMQSQNVYSNWAATILKLYSNNGRSPFFSLLSSSHIFVSFWRLPYRNIVITFRKVFHFMRKKLIGMKFYLQQHVRFIIQKNPKWFNLYGPNSCRGTQNGGQRKEFFKRKKNKFNRNERIKGSQVNGTYTNEDLKSVWLWMGNIMCVKMSYRPWTEHVIYNC